MGDINISEAEKTYIIHAVQDNYREDGRNNDEYRQMVLETGLMPHAHGSASMRLGNTEVLVGVKADLDEPKADRPNAGRLEFFVDCSAIATPEFEGRGGEALATAISNQLYRAYSWETVFDVKSLCLLAGKHCWVLYVDVEILQCGGNLFDAISIAVKSALFNTRIPNVTVRKEEGGEETDLEVPNDPYDVKRVDVSNAPVIVTLNKIGFSYVVDVSQKEEACCLARLMIAVTESGSVSAVVKEGQGSLYPDSVTEMMQIGQRVGKLLNQKLHKVLKDEEYKGLKRTTVGFMR